MTAERFRCTSPYLSRHGDIVRCDRCQLLFSNPAVATRTRCWRSIAPSRIPFTLRKKRRRERTFARSLLQLHRLAAPPGRLLDVGCYTGVFMKTGRPGGLERDRRGIERLGGGHRPPGGRRTGVHPGHWRTPGWRPASFDVISLWDVIEHLSHPAAMLKNVHRLLKPGGIVAVSTHRVDSPAARLAGPPLSLLYGHAPGPFFQVDLESHAAGVRLRGAGMAAPRPRAPARLFPRPAGEAERAWRPCKEILWLAVAPEVPAPTLHLRRLRSAWPMCSPGKPDLDSRRMNATNTWPSASLQRRRFNIK